MSRVYSHSQLESFENCPKQYAYRYIWHTKSEKARGVEGFLGDRVHKIAERTFHHYAHHETLVSVRVMLQAFENEWDSLRPERGLHVARRDSNEAMYRQMGVNAIYRFHQLLRTGVVGLTPHAIEMPLDFTVAGRPFTGVVDYVGAEGEGRLIEVRDWKSGKVRDNSDDRQLPLYEIGLRQRYADGADYDLIHEYLAFGVTKRRKVTGDDLAALEVKIGRTCDAIERETQWPAKPSALCAWCDYSDICEDSRA